MYSLLVLKDGINTSYPLASGTSWRIGRTPPCEIVVPDKRISGEHAEIVCEDGRFTLRLTKGKAAIKMNSKIIESAELTAGTSFDIADTNFTFVRTEDGMNLFDPRSVLASDWHSLAHDPATPESDASIENETHAIARRTSSATISPSRLLGQLVYLLRHAKDRETLARLVLDLVCQRLHADRAFLARVENSSSLRVIASHGIEGDPEIGKLVSTTVLKQLVDERRAVVIANVNMSDIAALQTKSFLRNKISAVACTPIFDSKGDLWALLYVDNQKRNSEFSAKDVELLIWLGQTYSLIDENLEMSRRLEQEVTKLKRTAIQEAEVVAEAPAMIQLLERARKAAASEANVLILGDSGTGKERVARLIHMLSPRSDKCIVARNCAAIPDNLFDSEMFGHKKGAFTGADSDRKGAFLEADGGTLFLDEIGDLDANLQTKLLRAIQEKKIRPVGSDKEIAVNVRLVSATNKDLREACKDKSFREDLFFRISTVILEVPPLRERKEDIVALSRHFTETLSGRTRVLSEVAEAKLQTYHWPGNVRELLSVLEQAIIFSAGTEITPDDLNLPMASGDRIELTGDSLQEVERRHILQVLQRANGNKTEAAKVLGLARSTLVLKLKAWNENAVHIADSKKQA